MTLEATDRIAPIENFDPIAAFLRKKLKLTPLKFGLLILVCNIAAGPVHRIPLQGVHQRPAGAGAALTGDQCFAGNVYVVSDQRIAISGFWVPEE